MGERLFGYPLVRPVDRPDRGSSPADPRRESERLALGLQHFLEQPYRISTRYAGSQAHAVLVTVQFPVGSSPCADPAIRLESGSALLPEMVMTGRAHPHTAFLASVAECFDAEAREEGTRLALRGDVHSLGGDATFAKALVLDTPARRVWLGLRDRMFEASCDCPQRSRGVFCRHIWALIVRGVSKGYLGGMGTGLLPAMRSTVPPQ